MTAIFITTRSTLNVSHAFAHGFQVLASYTWSKTLDNVDPDTTAQNPNDTNFVGHAEYGYAIYDQRHRAVFSGIYNAPFKMRVGGVSTLASSLPYNLVTGTTNSGNTGATTDRPVINGAVVSRNAGRGRPNYSLDPFVSRVFPLYREGVQIDLRAEAFNILNHQNFVGFNGTYGNGATAPATLGTPLARRGIAAAGAAVSIFREAELLMAMARNFAGFASWVVVAGAVAQTQTASIAGRVVDLQGKAVPTAQLTVRNTDVGTTRTLHADGAGAFRVSGLSPGAYSVEASGSGLVLRPAVRLTLTLGSSMDLLLQMRLPPTKQSTTVTARRSTVEGNTVAPTPNTSEAATGTFLPGLTITYLPNRDRDYTQFTTQAAGAEVDVDGAGLSIAGQRGNAIAVALDGTSFNDPLLGGICGGQDGSLFLPLTAVREFELLRSGVDSTVAVTGAAVVNVATKFGANRPRGEAFYTGRPSNFTSAEAFGHGLDGEQNAFGASYSGPIHKDRAFYAFSAEQDFVHAGRFVQFAPQATGIALPATLAEQQAQTIERQRPTALFTRLDFVLNPSNTLAAAFGWNRIDSKDVGDPFSRTLAAEDQSSSLGGHSVTTRVASDLRAWPSYVESGNDCLCQRPPQTHAECCLCGAVCERFRRAWRGC